MMATLVQVLHECNLLYRYLASEFSRMYDHVCELYEFANERSVIFVR